MHILLAWRCAEYLSLCLAIMCGYMRIVFLFLFALLGIAVAKDVIREIDWASDARWRRRRRRRAVRMISILYRHFCRGALFLCNLSLAQYRRPNCSLYVCGLAGLPSVACRRRLSQWRDEGLLFASRLCSSSNS